MNERATSSPKKKKKKEANAISNFSVQDINSPQPARPRRPAHHGRLRPRRPHPLLPPLRHLPAIQRQSPLRLHLRAGPRRLAVPAHHLLPHVSSALFLFPQQLLQPLPARVRARRCFPRPRGRVHVLDVDLPPIGERPGVLSAAARGHESRRRARPHGYGAGVCDQQCRYRVVYV